MEIYLLLIAAALLFFIVQSYRYKKRALNTLRYHIKNNWGKIPEREYSYEEFDKIPRYFESMRKKYNMEFIDDITWNDLDMDAVFMHINATRSSVGEDYLYYLLRTPVKNKEILEERNRLIAFFQQNTDISFKLEEIFSSISRTKKISLHEYIYRLQDLGKRSSLKHYFMSFLLIASILLLFFIPQYSIFFIVLMVAVNIIQYMKVKAEIECYFDCFKYLINMTVNAEKIIQLDIKELKSYNARLDEICKKLASFKRGVTLLASNNMSGSLDEVVLDYIRMLFHIDIIKFNSMLAKVMKSVDEIDDMFEVLGKIESSIAIASYRESKAYYCEPILSNSSNTHIYFKGIYHPLISEPVVNDLNENKGILLTGSNASGKSTFLKTVAINAILAQTINTCLAKEYNANYFSIYSSMALKDNLGNQESYYIVEIKSLKRILDHVKSEQKILCFIDEVLRGTNTVERIAASSQILKSLAQNNVLCFAATHDIELTHLLENDYANYHFQEEVINNDVKFNYQIYKGRATTRNAIKLLSIIGYDNSIIAKAEASANRFIGEGIWTIEND